MLGWADEVRRLRVRTNADTPEDARQAREFGAEGIGLCRTEHMFMQQDRLPHVRNMIMAETTDEREQHLAKLLPFQREDFDGIFRAMDGLPVTIRLLDPPLHEFLPNYTEVMVELERLRLTGASAEADRGAGEAGRPRSSHWPRPTRCWAPAAAAWASSGRRSTPCRCGPSSKRPPTCSPTPARSRTWRS